MQIKPLDITIVQSGIFLKPGEKISQEILEKLRKINKKYSETKNFPEYERSVRELFKLKPVQIKEKTMQFLAGFCEGEASMSAGAKKNSTSHFKVYIDPEFNLTQHVNGISNLYLALVSFKTGRIRHKISSNATFVFTIDNRQNLKEKVLPFYEKYVHPFGSPVKVRRTEMLKKLLSLFDEKAHLNSDRMINEVLPLWDAMRIQVGQSNETFQSLGEAQDYIRNAVRPLSSQGLVLKHKQKGDGN
uniref:Homing endonuclease LAGLIDADG domain-containing protein n=1 Tax=Ankistrodesmus stipitatus TaxID=3109 RepID=Q8WL11_9CHLO|nr:putative protein [Ankistrodesmus stipitatus]